MRLHFDNGSKSILSHYIEMVGGDLASLWEVGIDVPISLDQMEDFPLLDEPGGVPKRLSIFVLNYLPNPIHKDICHISYYDNSR